MKVSLNWLKEFVALPAATAELTELLTLAGVEVEGIETRGVSIENVVVAQILESTQHPNADRLSVCKVDDGSGTPRQIVCGAKNYKVGDKVPLALPGAVLPGDFKIKVGKLRGVESQGMLCSAKELALAEDADGLLILPPAARSGAPISELFPGDTILDLEITPNRADLLSHIGIAREIAALTRRHPERSEAKRNAVEGSHGASGNPDLMEAPQDPSNTLRSARDDVRMDAPELCPFYTARRIQNVTVAPSPAWLRNKLESIGVRSINNVVDITNYVMLEMGQPLHAFDAGKLRGDISVRMAREGEKFLALDGRTFPLASRHLVIADAERAIAIAGVMGGEETGVTEATTEVILESAYFQPGTVRRTSRELGLMSDSSYRFERGVDPQGVLAASQRATELIAEIAGGVPGPLSVSGAAPDFSRTVPLRANRCDEVLGAHVSEDRIREILTALGLRATDGGWQVPSFRQDLAREIDLVEEVTRVFGIENVPSRTVARFASGTAADRAHDLEMNVRRQLAAHGFFEARTLSLISENANETQLLPREDVRRVRNPLTEDQVVLRSSLLPGLLQVAAHNARSGARRVRMFEVGRVFGAEERTHLAVVLSGSIAENSWRNGSPRDADLFDLKGLLGATPGLAAGLEFEPAKNDRLALALRLRMGIRELGEAGQLWPAQARALDFTGPVFIAEIDLGAMETGMQKLFQGLNKFPSVTRDIALMVGAEIPHGKIAATLRSANEPLLERVELFDVFADPTGEKIAAGKKSLAYSLTYRASDRTLSADEANAAHARLKERLKAEFEVAFRE